MLIVKENDFLEVNLNSLVADYDRLILTNLYQPIIGYKAVGLYFTLLTEAENQKINPIINHKTLFTRMQMNAGDFVDSRKLLEAVGLLKTFVSDLKENKFYQYELYAPKTPKLFFDNTLLYGMLIKSVGETDANKLRTIYLINRQPEGTDITASFIEVFAPDLDDPAFRKAMEGAGSIVSRQTAKLISGFSYELFSKHLSEISQIKAETFSKEDMKEIERLATLYAINEESAAQAVSELYDPYSRKGNRIDFEELAKRFMDESSYRILSNRRFKKGSGVSGETALANKINLMEKVSPKEYLSALQNGTAPALSDLKIINDISKKFSLPSAVINALIDYVLTVNDNILSRPFAEKIAASLAREDVTTAIDAMNYLKKIRKRGKKKDSSESNRNIVNDSTNNNDEIEEPTLSRKEILDQLEEDDDDGED